MLVIVLCVFQKTLGANCTSLIQDYINYLTTSDPGYRRYVTFLMSSIKAPAVFVGFSSGELRVAYRRVGKFGFIQTYLFAKDAKTVFSDRTWCPESPGGEFICSGYQKFDYRKADTFQMSLNLNSTAKIVLTTWGNATYTVPLECKDGFLYGTLK